MGTCWQLICTQTVHFTAQTSYSDISVASKVLQGNEKISLKVVGARKQGWLVRVRGNIQASNDTPTFILLVPCLWNSRLFPHDWIMVSWSTPHQFIGMCKPPYSCHKRITKGSRGAPEKSCNSHLKYYYYILCHRVKGHKWETPILEFDWLQRDRKLSKSCCLEQILQQPTPICIRDKMVTTENIPGNNC